MTTKLNNNNLVIIRPYDPIRDRSSIEEICANNYGGSDYLPKMADLYHADELCSFLALEMTRKQQNDDDDDNDDANNKIVAAVANYKRLPAQNSVWIEAVRTHANFRNQGLASALLQSMLDLAKEEDSDRRRRNNLQQEQQSPPTNILTCTVESNKGMQRVFEKLGFVQTNKICIVSFSALRQLPGWSISDNAQGGKPLLDALDLQHLLSPDATSIPASSWTTITSELRLLELLREMQREGGTCGFLPGLFEYIVPGQNRLDLKQSLERGLVLELDIPSNKEMSGCDKCEEGRSERAILVFTQDERITSLKSNWICSISAHSTLAFEAALHYAHSSDIAHRINGTTEMIPFCLCFDDAVPIKKGTIAHELPRGDDECIVFSYKYL
jgi:GNAT superfamily N-acetyltransferase